jgi:molybdate transport system regulatory protein
MPLSARNQLPGVVTDIKLGSVMAQVTIDIGNGIVIVAAITADAVAALGIAVGSEVTAVIKATEVMVATR